MRWFSLLSRLNLSCLVGVLSQAWPQHRAPAGPRVSVGAGDSRSCLPRVSLLAGDRLVKGPAQRPAAHTPQGAGSREGPGRRLRGGALFERDHEIGSPQQRPSPCTGQVRPQPWHSQVHLWASLGRPRAALHPPAGHTANPLRPEPSRISPLAPTRQTFPLAEQMGVEFPSCSFYK